MTPKRLKVFLFLFVIYFLLFFGLSLSEFAISDKKSCEMFSEEITQSRALKHVFRGLQDSLSCALKYWRDFPTDFYDDALS